MNSKQSKAAKAKEAKAAIQKQSKAEAAIPDEPEVVKNLFDDPNPFTKSNFGKIAQPFFPTPDKLDNDLLPT